MTDTTDKSSVLDSTSCDEPEMNSISFKDSLRFFREQLSTSTVSLDDGKLHMEDIKMSANSNFEEYEIHKKDTLEKGATYTSSKILPIPTVDTILESVRILKAIQKSQEQRGGTLWPRDITSTENQDINPYQVLELEVPKDLLDNGTISSILNGSFQETKNGGNGCTALNSSTTGCNLDEKYNSRTMEDFQNQRNVKLTAERFWPTVLSLAERHSSLSVTSELMEESDTSKTGQQRVDENLFDLDDGSTLDRISLLDNALRNRSPTENMHVFMPCSPSLNDYQNVSKLEMTIPERSTSTELDSGMGTDKSVGSLSPVRGEVDPDKDLWSDDSSHSHYASAAESPCESLTGTPDDGLDFSNDELQTPGDNFEATHDDICVQNENRGLHILSSDEPHEISPIRNVVSSESPCGSEKTEDSSPIGDQVCMSRDRLVETIEDKIQQREFQVNKLDASSNNTPKKDLKYTADYSVSTHSNSDGYSEQPNLSNLSTEQLTSASVYDPEVNMKNELIFSGDVASCDEKGVNMNLADNKSNGETDGGKNICDSSSLTEEMNSYVSTAKCVFGSMSSDLSVPEIDPLTEDEERRRTKKNVTLSWDPVPLMEHLYRIEEQNTSKDADKKLNTIEGYVDVQPVGIFSGQKGSHYFAVDDHCLYIYESDKKEKTLVEIQLKYAHVESVAKNEISVDSKLGKHVSFRCSEQEALLWKECLLSQCSSASKWETVVPVNYPLQSHKNVIVIDLGSCSTRAGILTDQPTLPKLFFPSVCATDKTSMVRHYGVEALHPEVRQNSTLSFPVRQSQKITKFTMDIDALKGLFEKIFRDLNVDQHKYTVQLCVPRSLSTNTQAALVKLLIEELGVQAVSLTAQALLTLYANNTSSAIVVDIGERMDVMPVVDGFILECGVSKLPHGGQQIVHHLKHALAQKHISLSNDIESFVVRYIAESLCYVAENYDKELQNAMSFPEHVKKSLHLYPFFKDETKLQTVTLDIGRFQVPEGLFDPNLWGLDFPGLHKLVHQAIQSSGMDVRRRMAENIYISGGVTLIPGFAERLENEVAKLTLPRLKPQVRASPYRYHMAYLGACQLAASEAFQQVCVNSKEWFAKGPVCLRKWHL